MVKSGFVIPSIQNRRQTPRILLIRKENQEIAASVICYSDGPRREPGPHPGVRRLGDDVTRASAKPLSVRVVRDWKERPGLVVNFHLTPIVREQTTPKGVWKPNTEPFFRLGNELFGCGEWHSSSWSSLTDRA